MASIHIGYENLINYHKKYVGDSLIVQLSHKDSIRINNYGDKCVRDFPHCESPEMYELFKDEQIVEKNIDLTRTHVELFGEQIKKLNGTNNFDNFNRIYVRGAESLIENFMVQKGSDLNVNIFLNSIRNIPGSVNLHKFENLNSELFNINDKSVQQYITNYGKTIDNQFFEFPMTQQYCNWYEYFNLKTKKDYYKCFVVIVTNEKMYSVYRELYPHFIIITQPNTSFQCVGLTRHTELVAASQIKLKKIVCIDDNIINIQMPNFDYDTAKINNYNDHYYLKKLTVLEQLFKLDNFKLQNLNETDKTIVVNIDDYGYLGTANGFNTYNKNAKWVENSFKQNYFQDYILRNISSLNEDIQFLNQTDNSVKNHSLYFRDYINTPHQNSEIPSSDTTDMSFLNPHRLKFIIVNIDVMKSKKISYNPIHTMAEDIFLSREIFKHNLKTCQISLGITAAKDERRPITCTSVGCAINSEQFNNILDETEKINTEKMYPFRSDLITYKGGLLFFNEKGILASSGTFGPAKLITNDMKIDYDKSVEDAIKEDKYITKDNKLICIDRFKAQRASYKPINGDKLIDINVDYINPSKYKQKLYEIDNKNEKLILKYKKTGNERYGSEETVIANYLSDIVQKITNLDIRKTYIDNFIQSYKKWFDIVSVSFNNILSNSHGMNKYVREYEYENILSFKYFIDFYERTSDIVDIVYTKINNEDKCNRKNDILFYLDNYDKMPEDIFKLLSLYIIFSKIKGFTTEILSYSDETNKTFNNGNKKLFNIILLLFGNINDIIYINDKVRELIQNFYQIIFLNITKDIDTELEFIVNESEIWEIYNLIKKEYFIK